MWVAQLFPSFAPGHANRVTTGPSAPNALVNSEFRLCFAAIGLMVGACATPTRAVPAALDPANPDAEETTGAAITPLVVPGPPADAATDAADGMPGPAHAGHDMAAMKKDSADPHAGHDMATMKKDSADPHAGHDMAAMKKDTAETGGEEEHLMGVVTRLEAATLTVILEKGSSAIILLDGNTAFERGDEKTSAKGIHVGERIVVHAVPQNGKWLARVVKLAPATPKNKADAGSPSPPHEHAMSPAETKTPPQVQQFTCPMHPEIRSATPGKCPKCGMKLQPVSPP